MSEHTPHPAQSVLVPLHGEEVSVHTNDIPDMDLDELLLLADTMHMLRCTEWAYYVDSSFIRVHSLVLSELTIRGLYNDIVGRNNDNK